MKRTLLTTLLITAPVYAQETISSTASSSGGKTSPRISLSVSSSHSAEFLDYQGIFSSAQLLRSLNAQLTSEQRATIEQAVDKRNTALSAANSELSATLRSTLGESNEQLAQRVEDSAELQRLEEIRRRQPARYFYFLEKFKKRQKARKTMSVAPAN